MGYFAVIDTETNWGITEEVAVGDVRWQQFFQLRFCIARQSFGHGEHLVPAATLPLRLGNQHGVHLGKGHGKYFFVGHFRLPLTFANSAAS